VPKDGIRTALACCAGATTVLLILVSPASAAVQYVSDSTTDPSNHVLSVACPPGTHVTGGGESTGNGYKGLRLRGSYPFDNASDADSLPDDGWRVVYTTPNPYNVEIDAACATQLPTYKSSPFSIAATSRGTKAVGCGYRQVYSGGAAGGTLVSVLPRDGSDGDLTPDDSFQAKVDNLRPVAVQAEVFAVCGPSAPTYPTTSSSLGPKKEDEFDANCPAGVSVIGGGAGIAAKYRKGLINSLFPFLPDGDGWGAYFDNYSTSPKPVTTVAVCANLP
jgi:hypothetical protein